MQAIAQKSNKSLVKIIMIFLLLFIVVFVLFIYTFLHESGHALIGFFFGQKLTEFHINFLTWDTHVTMAGNLSPAQAAIQSMAGAGLPLLIWFVFLCLVPRNVSFSLEVLKLVGSMAVLNTLLPWIVLPILYLFGKAPPDDVTNFLRYSQMPPLLLTFVAVALYSCGWILFLAKIDGFRKEFLLFRATDRETLLAGARRTIPFMTGIMVVCAIVVLLANDSAASTSSARFVPPPGLEPVAQIDLSSQAYADATLTQFSLEKPDYVRVFVVIHNINTSYFDLRIIGSNGYSSVVLHGEGYSAYQDGGLWEKNLPPGTYQLVLTSHQSPGTASIYVRPHQQ